MTGASLARRIGALLYDSLLITALLFLGTVPFVAARGGEPVDPGNLLYQLTLVTIVLSFFVGFWSGYGRTLGMQSWGLRIESVHGGKPSVAQSLARFAAAIVSWLPAGLGFWWQLWDPDSLTWHDRWSNTRLRYRGKRKRR